MWEFKHSINSSKVYCKYVPSAAYMLGSSVLIVAKCIVNSLKEDVENFDCIVLIVAKCIVNDDIELFSEELMLSINSSKVYCK